MITPIYPEYISFDNFAGRFYEDYPEAHLPIIQDPKQWVTWASAVAINPIFSRFLIPQPNKDKANDQEAWKDWAKQLYICITNNINN